MSDIAERISKLSPEKRALLLQKLVQKGQAETPASIPVQDRSNGHVFPMSSTQERFWFIYQLDPNSPTYNVPLMIRLTAELDVEALQRSLDEIVRRHESLRTTFQMVNREPMQVIHQDSAFPLKIIDFCSLPDDEQRQQEIKDIIEKEGRTPFNLEKGPLMRAVLLQLPDENLLIVNFHHIVVDQRATGLFGRELDTLYEAFSQGKPSPLRPLPLQYADYSFWQRQQKGAEDLAYWKKQLGGSLPALDLPTDRHRPMTQTTAHGKEHVHPLPPEVAEKAKLLARQEGATLFVALLAVFDILLHRYTGQTDIRVGSLIANRNRPELQDLIGCFINTLVFRNDLSGDPTFRELLQRVKEVSLSAYRHADFPFEELVKALQPKRDLSHTPLFQVLFEVLANPMDFLQGGDKTVREITEISTETSRFDLRLEVKPIDGVLSLAFTYNTDLFNPDTVARFAKHYQALLEQIVDNPRQRISELSLLTPVEADRILVEWNETKWDYPREQSVVDLIEAHAVQTPEAVAVQFGTRKLTFEQLNRRANRLAHYLQAQGIRPGMRVGLCLEPSLELSIGLLGILKAGAAYVPLDPDYPQERLEYVLNDSQIDTLLTEQKLLVNWPELRVNVICLDTEWDQIRESSGERPSVELTLHYPAYVLYTSGSTGRPKGVVVSHENLLSSTLARRHYYEHQPRGFLLLSSFAFDSSVVGIFWTLCEGGTLYLPQKAIKADVVRLASLIWRREITHILCIPSLYAVILDHAGEGHLNSLQTVIVAGEACPPELVKVHYEQLPDTPLYNEYGPTEATVWSSVHYCRVENRSLVPIGRPIANAQIYLLDGYLQPVPVGVPGELYIGGSGVSSGYWNRPGLTAEKFIPNPFGDSANSRLYKSGDLARYRANGDIEFLGRVDHQAKIRGYRIELGEIEALLSQSSRVREAVTLVRADEPNNKQLVAYVIPDFENAAIENEITGEEHVSQWQTLYDDIHEQPPAHHDPAFNIIGWNSSYTGMPIPENEMREWVDHTVNTILNWEPKQVLEIGCGTGLLLFSIAPQVSRYWGADFSDPALDHVRQQLASAEFNLPHVSLFHKRAEDFAAFEGQTFDTIILNSVIQYFPSIEYLIDVLGKAVNVIEPGGRIFIGDVRNLQLLDAFHTSVQLFQATDSISSTALIQRSRRSLSQDKELVVDPRFFAVLKRQFPQIEHVEVRPKRGRAHNELTKFRYDVVLHIQGDERPIVEPDWLDWEQEGLTYPNVWQHLAQEAPPLLALRGVPNKRVTADVKTVEWLAGGKVPETAEELRRALAAVQPHGEDPEQFWSLANELPYDVHVSWLNSSADGRYDVVLRRREETKTSPVKILYEKPRGDKSSHRPWRDYANNPLQSGGVTGTDLREYLEAKLPGYMVPAAFILMDEFPRNPNGKVARDRLPAPGFDRAAQQKTYLAPRTEQEKLLAEIWEQVLGRDEIGIHDNFFELGGDSILSIRILARANQAGLHMSSVDIFKHQTIAELAAILSSESLGLQASQEPVTGAALLTPVQHWFLEQSFHNACHWNQALLLETTHALRPDLLEKAIWNLVKHHDALRLRFEQTEADWQQTHASVPDESPFERFDFAALPAGERAAAFQKQADKIQAGLDLKNGPLFKGAYFNLGTDQPGRLLLVAHHLVIDFVSMQILVADLEMAYRQLVEEAEVTLPPKKTSFKEWTQALTDYAQTEALVAEAHYWAEIAGRPLLPLPVDFPDGIPFNIRASVCTVERVWDREQTRALLQDVPPVYRTQINDVLLAALALGYARWTGSERILLDLEGHGREGLHGYEGLDLSRTVGWFTSIYPVSLYLPAPDQPGESLKAVKEQLRQVPNHGIGYGLLRYLAGSEAVSAVRQQLHDWPGASISFNYLGQFNQFDNDDAIFRPSQEASGQWYDPQSLRTHLIDVHGIVVDGRLRMSWNYSENIHRRSTVEALAQHFDAALQGLIAHCLSPDAGGVTPSDFPLAGLDQNQLEKILARKVMKEANL